MQSYPFRLSFSFYRGNVVTCYAFMVKACFLQLKPYQRSLDCLRIGVQSGRIYCSMLENVCVSVVQVAEVLLLICYLSYLLSISIYHLMNKL